ncbi:MAG: hypothetical protein WDA71_02950 [Actinomycetota bacterium]
MVEVLVIPDGACEDPRLGPTSLERARTPVLDGICAQGEVRAVRTIPAGLPAGSEVGIPVLLGMNLRAVPSRGLIEAAAAGIRVPGEMWAWRVDVPREATAEVLSHKEHERWGLTHLKGHRFLAISKSPPALPDSWRVWPTGVALPRILASSVVVVAAAGAAVGCARLLGAHVVVPAGGTGDTDTDYRAKAHAALEALEELGALATPQASATVGSTCKVVVHLGGPDEASHRGDRAEKIAAIEAIDEMILAPLRDEVRRRGGILTVCPDHGTDPVTGRHLEHPVPCVRWGAGVRASGPLRLAESDLREGVRV